MSSAVLRHLCRSREVRAALTRELFKLLTFIATTIVPLALVRHFVTGKQPFDWDMLLTAAAFALCWLVSAVRTARAALRDHGYLD